MKRIENMIAGVSLSALAQLRPTMATSGDSQSQESAPTNTAAPAAPPIESKPTISPGLNVVAAASGTEENGTSTSDETPAEQKSAEPGPDKPAEQDSTKPTGSQSNEPKGTDGEVLTQEEQAEVAKLQARDREVRAHEQAHMAAGGGVTGGATYSYQSGPDGKQYAVGGEVSVRTTASGDNPRQQIAQLQQVARAALAPASPSGQDRAVAANARAQAAQIQAQLAQESLAKAQEALQGGADKAQAASEAQGAPAEPKKLLPELPEIAKPTISRGNDDGSGAEKKTSGAQPIAASVIAPAEKKSYTPTASGANSDTSIASSIAAYQQQVGAANGDNGNGSNGIKPIAPAVSGRVISLNA